MIGFVALAVVLAVLAVAFITLPLLRRERSTPPAWRAAALAGGALVVISAALYVAMGNSGWAHQKRSPDAISSLMRHLAGAPDDIAAWDALGQDYTSIGEYPLSLRAYERANRLAKGTDAEALAGMGAAMLMGGDHGQSARAAQFLDRALLLNPRSPKALFYGAVAAYAQGRYKVSRDRFQTMLTLQPPPPADVVQALKKQIALIDQRLHPQALAATAIHLRVTLDPALASKVPRNASLFVFVPAPDGGPPLAVRRSDLRLPQTLELSSADSMLAGHGLTPGQHVAVVARISASGSPLAHSGDLYGEIHCVAGAGGVQVLRIDRLSP